MNPAFNTVIVNYTTSSHVKPFIHTGESLEHEDILLRAHLLEYLEPHADRDFAQVRLAQQLHQGSRLADLSARGPSPSAMRNCCSATRFYLVAGQRKAAGSPG